jgi:hypothetical protein
MGADATAILAFGFQIGGGEIDSLPMPPWRDEEGSSRDEYEDGFEDWVYSISGLVEPETKDYKDDAWSKHWDAEREALKACPVVEVLHCNWDQAMYILAINGAVHKTDWGVRRET